MKRITDERNALAERVKQLNLRETELLDPSQADRAAVFDELCRRHQDTLAGTNNQLVDVSGSGVGDL